MGDISSIVGETQVTPLITIVDDSLAQVTNRLSDVLGARLKTAWSFGTGANQVNKAYIAQAVFNQATVQTYNVEDGSLKNVFGGNFDPDAIKYIVISHDKDSVSSGVTITGTFMSTNNLGSPTLPAGAKIVLERPSDGWPVVATNTIITTNNDASNDATVDYVLLGEA